MKNCSHPSCDCQFDETKMIMKNGRRYCSEHCASHGLGDASPCECGHPECRS